MPSVMLPKERNLLINIGFVATLLIAFIIGTQYYRNAETMWVSERLEKHFSDLSLAWEKLLSYLASAETAQQRYIITGSQEYLRHYTGMLNTVTATIAFLQSQAATDPSQRQRIDEVLPAVKDKIADMQLAIDVRRRQGFPAAERLVNSDRTTALTNTIRGQIVAAQIEAQNRYQASIDHHNALRRETTRTVFSGAVLSYGFLFVILIILRRELTRRTAAEQRLLDYQEHLQELVTTRTHELETTNEHLSGEIAERRKAETTLVQARADAERRAAEAEEGRRILDALMANIPEGIIITNAEGKMLRISNSMARISGYTPAEATGRHFSIIDKILSRTSKPLAQDQKQMQGEKSATAIAEYPYPLERALAGGDVTVQEEHQVYLPDGNSRTVVINAVPIKDFEHRIAGAVTSWQDITDRKKAEEAIRSANRELEQFAYVASHDLQEPLRMVASFTEILSRRYQGSFDERGRKYLGYIVDGATRMQHLIQDLLTFSRVGRLDTERHRVDLNAVADNVISDLAENIRETRAEVTHNRLPLLFVNESSMARLFTNLVGNALKFRKKDVPPRVHIAAQRRGNEWQFAVRDNGIGIDPRYFDKLFVIFQRLHGRQEYPGTGMGLAICKKIVDNYGGRIWVESQPGKGSTFFFTIPQ